MRSPALLVLLILCFAPRASGQNWPRFRGNDQGHSGSSLPRQWNEAEGIAWKTALPGPGSSSPIIHGDRLFLTCYSGYGTPSTTDQPVESLVRHLVCLDRKTGTILWNRKTPSEHSEDPFSGYIQQHGYASSTPVTDGKNVYVFYGKTGVLAFDYDGTEVWRTNVGTESSSRHWGSGSSPVLFGDQLIINAADESRSVISLDKNTGLEIWRAEAEGLELSFNTPLIVNLPENRKDLIIAVPDEIWGLNPETGKLRWYAETGLDGNVSPSVVTGNGIVHVFGGFRKRGSIAIRAGGKGNVTDTHVEWKSPDTSYVPSPLLHENHLYWMSDRGQFHCARASDGKLVFKEKISGDLAGGARSRSCYASVIRAGEHILAMSRISGGFIFDAKPQYKRVAHNRIATDTSDFNATPAVSDNRLYLRSNRFAYCIGKRYPQAEPIQRSK